MPSPKGGGRKSRYEQKFCKELIEHLKSGNTFSTFDKVVDVPIRTLYKWTSIYPEFGEAREQGEAMSPKRATAGWER